MLDVDVVHGNDQYQQFAKWMVMHGNENQQLLIELVSNIFRNYYDLPTLFAPSSYTLVASSHILGLYRAKTW